MKSHKHVTTNSDTARTEAAPDPATRRRATQSRRNRRRLITGFTLVSALTLGATVTAQAHRTVTLDVDGEVRTIGTFRRTVGALLEREGIELGAHDEVAPDTSAPLADGAEVVIRHGHQVEFEVDGEQATEWVAALYASDALGALRDRGRDVRLVASRSAGRAELPLRMVSPGGVIAVVADGRTVTTQYAGLPLDETMRAAGVTVSEDDAVSLLPPADADVPAAYGAELAIVVQRIRTTEVREHEPIAYERVTRTDAARYRDLGPLVVQDGAEGELTRVYAVTTVDGEEVEREFVSESVTPPVNRVVAYGTRERAFPTGGFSEAVWRGLAQCESNGNPRAVSAGGRFHGLYQFSVATWRSMGGTGLPSQASPLEQRQRAVALQARWGWGQWPACSARLGLR